MQRSRPKSHAQIKAEGIQRAIQWQALIGTNGIESKADLARYLGVSRTRVTQVLKRLTNHQNSIVETTDFSEN